MQGRTIFINQSDAGQPELKISGWQSNTTTYRPDVAQCIFYDSHIEIIVD